MIHGTTTAYRNYACRCRECKDAQAAEMKRRRHTDPDFYRLQRITSDAQKKALARLGRRFPVEYRELVNEERAKVGLPPLRGGGDRDVTE